MLGMLNGVQKVVSSNLTAPTIFSSSAINDLLFRRSPQATWGHSAPESHPPQAGYYGGGNVPRLPPSSEIKNTTRNRTNNTFAIRAATPASAKKPTAPAISATIRNISAYRNITPPIVLFPSLRRPPIAASFFVAHRFLSGARDIFSSGVFENVFHPTYLVGIIAMHRKQNASLA